MDQGILNGLSVLFCHTPPKWVLEKGVQWNEDHPWSALCPEDKFIPAFQMEYPERSRVEIGYILQRLRAGPAHTDMPALGLFSLVLSVARTFLRMDGTEIRCRHEKMVEWRLATHQMGQSIFLCAFLAWNDLQSDYYRTDFAFSPYAKTDDLRLRHILAKGMAENHFHLKGSAPAAFLSWVCLMNYIQNREGADGFGNRELRATLSQSFGDDGENTSDASRGVTRATRLYLLVATAAYLRVCLWRAVSEIKATDPPEYPLWSRDRIEFLPRWTRQVQQEIDIERFFSGKHLDYLHCGMPRPGQAEQPYYALSGEHRLLYMIFRNMLQDSDWCSRYGTMVYAYLLIFVRFRRELTQCNNVYGFDNFQAYQNRKELFLNRQYQDELLRMAYLSALGNPAMQSLESRIVLDPDRHVMQEKLRRYMDSIPPMDKPGDRIDHDPRVFFVVHLPKRMEPPLKQGRVEWLGGIPCRHDWYRRNYVWPQIVNLVSLFRHRNPLVERIYGLDACSQEIGCRPEVFAPAFRYARHMALPQLGVVLEQGTPPTLRFTYHVGEDFLDVVDGLRAIDEAIRYLELRNGDRLGHALAMGIDPVAWYAKRAGSMILKAQDALDNVAWLRSTLRRLGYVDGRLSEWLRTEFDSLCDRIFGRTYSTVIYMQAWLLRGDDPNYYTGRMLTLQNDKSCQLSSNQTLQPWRQLGALPRQLYYDYHFNPEARRKGEELIEFSPPSGYAQAVKAVQLDMQKRVSRMGIGIETNPSSNYLINRFGGYEQHPLVAFNDMHLRNPESGQSLFVSINTDDQGVFDTDLENEFALMVCALENAKDSDGNCLFAQERIYQWIDQVRQMGVQQSFMLPEQKGR